ncbi:hypothetical protein K438DRAFT_1988630 [Mycena galopus ATCC 62051]|nr:hypothetical protein K438DRAFT_1988630 [Mycena galopus ATCC 62051]
MPPLTMAASPSPSIPYIYIPIFPRQARGDVGEYKYTAKYACGSAPGFTRRPNVHLISSSCITASAIASTRASSGNQVMNRLSAVNAPGTLDGRGKLQYASGEFPSSHRRRSSSAPDLVLLFMAEFPDDELQPCIVVELTRLALLNLAGSRSELRAAAALLVPKEGEERKRLEKVTLLQRKQGSSRLNRGEAMFEVSDNALREKDSSQRHIGLIIPLGRKRDSSPI